MKLNNLKPAEGSVHKRKRIGRGQGSGKGGTSTRGHKGAKSRSGYSRKKGFEGGQMPLQRRVPKFGFNNINRIEYKAVNLDDIQKLAEKGNLEQIDKDILFRSGLISKKSLVKILGKGELSKKVEIHADAFSKSAIQAIEGQGGKAVIIERFKSKKEDPENNDKEPESKKSDQAVVAENNETPENNSEVENNKEEN
jgi:large subunit ribosomal protein L15